MSKIETAFIYTQHFTEGYSLTELEIFVLGFSENYDGIK